MCENTHEMYDLRNIEERSGNICAADKYEVFLILVPDCKINYAQPHTTKAHEVN